MDDTTPSSASSSGDASPLVAGSSNHWGLTEATLAWPAATVVGTLLYVVALQVGEWSASIPERPGGHFGRAAGQLATDQVLRNDTLPVAWQMLLLLPGWIVLLGVVWLFAGALGRDRSGWSLRGEATDVPLGIAGGFLLQFPIVIMVVLLVQLIFGETEQSGRALALVDSADTWPKVLLLVLFVGIGAPVVEELFYRGVVQRSLVSRLGPLLGITIASLIFGAVHFRLVELAPLAAVGAGLGFLYWKTGRLLPAVMGHVTFNMLTLVNLIIATR